MSAQLVFLLLLLYFGFIFFIAFYTSRGATSKTFFQADKSAPWPLVAYGMIGATLSGITFISIPGWVGSTSFSYLQMVMGYLLGYLVIATVLLPLYYRLNLVSIYAYLEGRFGFFTYKTGAFYFLLSRSIGAAFRLYLVAGVLQLFLFDALGVPFWLTVVLTIGMIWLYTFRGGINTVLWTDTLQTTFMLLAVGLTIFLVNEQLNWSFSVAVAQVGQSSLSEMFFWDDSKQNFFKQFFSGAFIAIVMTGLDQDMMQKNLTCKSLKDAQKNMFWFSIVLVVANILFLFLGALLYLYSSAKGIALPVNSDNLYPLLARDHLGTIAGSVFFLGIVAAAYSSADSALTSLTTSFCIDFLEFDKQKTGEARKRMRRIQVHLMFSGILLLLILLFKLLDSRTIIDRIFTVASYTYGPLLGLYAFGLFTRWNVKDPLVPVVCLLSPIACLIINYTSDTNFGYELLMLNGLLTFVGLFLIRKARPSLSTSQI